MHEYSITSSILEILQKVIDEKNLKKVKKLNFELSKLASIEPESIKFYFNFLTKDDEILKGARLHFKKINIEVRCNDCNKTYDLKSFEVKCPNCLGKNVNVVSMDDIKIISVVAD
jgi:hydrogenase nickel incorporation protein HypA/HybF